MSTTDDAPPTWAVIGAGYLGSAVAHAAPASVIASTRTGQWRDGPTPPGVRMLSLDVGDADLQPQGLGSATAAVMCYAPGRTQDRHALYVEGTRRLLDRWPSGTLRRLVWVGSTSALPDRDAWLDERCDVWPTSERGIVQRRAEQVVIDHASARGIPWLVLRLGGLYGPDRALDRLYRRRREGPLPGDGMAPTNLIHRDDAVSAVLAAMAAPPSLSGVVHVVDDDHTPRRQMYRRIAAVRGIDAVEWAEPARPNAVPRGKRVSNRRLKQLLGVRLTVPMHRLEEQSAR
ncbi:MAG: NAD-dependent epimerase/dehydratase family protein [Deltaproteobacteria bacterium]|nr:NAD-dependent epimerase/dehydratase family protein [Deltaproteobacteria bacterium]